MAYILNPLGADHFRGTNTIVTSAPLTISAWIKTNVYRTCMIVELSDGSNSNRHTLVQEASSYLAYSSSTSPGSADLGSIINTQPAGNWQHVCAVFASATSRTPYLNGVAGTTNTTPVTPVNINTIVIGSRTDSAFTFDGTIAEVAVYNKALSQAEINALYGGQAAYNVAHQNLKIYAPLIREFHEIASGITLTPTFTGRLPTTHHRIYY